MMKDGIPPHLETRYDEYFKLEERFDKMEKINLVKLSKRLSYLLRHNPENLDMDTYGWVSVDEILNKLDVTFVILDEIVKDDDKNRYSFNETKNKIRANQGHTIDVDLGLKETIPLKYLYHGTSPIYYKDIIKSGGLSKMKRNHVHLSKDKETAYTVGKRHSKHLDPLILIIDAEKMYKDGYKFYLSDNGVWLTEYVPKKYIKI